MEANLHSAGWKEHSADWKEHFADSNLQNADSNLQNAAAIPEITIRDYSRYFFPPYPPKGIKRRKVYGSTKASINLKTLVGLNLNKHFGLSPKSLRVTEALDRGLSLRSCAPSPHTSAVTKAAFKNKASRVLRLLIGDSDLGVTARLFLFARLITQSVKSIPSLRALHTPNP